MVRQEEERKKCADEGKKFKCRDYVIIGDPAKELKRSPSMSSTRTLPAFCS